MSLTIHLLPAKLCKASPPSVIPGENLTLDQNQNARCVSCATQCIVIEFIHAVKPEFVPNQISPLIRPVPPMSRAAP